MSAFGGGGAAEAKRQEVVSIRSVTDALENFRAIINDTARSSRDLGVAGEATVAAIKGTSNAMNDFARTGIFAAAQSFANSAAAGSSGDFLSSAAAGIGAAGSGIPVLGDSVFAPAYQPVSEAVQRTSAITTNLARVGVETDQASIAESLSFTYSQGKRAVAAHQRVVDTAKEMGLYDEALSEANERGKRLAFAAVDYFFGTGFSQQ